MKVALKLTVRQALKDFAKHAVKCGKSGTHSYGHDTLSKLVRESIDSLLCQQWTRELAEWLIESEKYAAPRKDYQYAKTPWTSMKVHIDLEVIEKLKVLAASLELPMEPLIRGSLFNDLEQHYPFPDNQAPAEDADGYFHHSDIDEHGEIIYIDPRHPDNKGRELEAFERLLTLATAENSRSEHWDLYLQVIEALIKMDRNYRQFEEVIKRIKL